VKSRFAIRWPILRQTPQLRQPRRQRNTDPGHLVHWLAADVAGVVVCFGSRALAATLYVWRDSPSPAPPYATWATAAHTIQAAVNAATAGDEIVVTHGVYATGGRAVYGTMTNRVAVDKPVLVRSVNGPEVTVIEGYQVPGTTNGDGAVRCVYLADGAVLSGFTLTNGANRSAGDEYKEQRGGGVWCTSGSPVASNCTFTGNSAYIFGGGAYYGTLNNCTLAGNSAGYGGGASWAALNNSILTGNSVDVFGGGAYISTLNNCTLTGNWAGQGGGAYDSTLKNCILYYNTADPASAANHRYGTLDYCCTTPFPWGVGNFTAAPLFVDYAGGNLRLQSNSPCINAGLNAYAPGETDLDGRPRIVGGTADMGAYEYQGAGMGEFIGWLQQHGLPTDGSADFTDPDGDRLNNWQEWLADTDPTNALSVLRIESIAAGPPVTVQFTSSSNRFYSLLGCTNLTAPVWMDVPGQTDVPGSGGLQALRDTNAAPPRFYRVGVRVP
jgi:hypothetical protein